MSQLSPTFGQIRARVQAVRRKVPDARAFGIQSPNRWAGNRLRRDGEEMYRIEQCDGPLAARIALLDEEPGVTVTVLVTSLSDQELGEDVVVRLGGRKLYPIDPWQIVKELYLAQAVDPRLRAHSWVADRLLDLVGTLPVAQGGYLDAEAIWPALLQRLIGLEGDRPDLAVLLRWSAQVDYVQRLRRLPDEVRRGVVDWLAVQVGPAAADVLRCALAQEQPDALAVGLVLGIVHHPQAEGRLDRAAGRVERFLGGMTPERGIVDRWAAAATEAVRLQDNDRCGKDPVLDRAEDLLREVQADAFAHLSEVLPRGFDQRLARLGGLLAPSAPAADLREARDAIRRHDQARRESPRLERVEMTLRLVRWLDTPTPPAPLSLGEAARDYLVQGSFVDWARSVLKAGDAVSELSEGYARLVARVAERRHEQNRAFAELLRDQTAAAGAPAELIPVERVLDEVVAPLAAAAPVLVLLLDGMSPAVARELLADLGRNDWVVLGPGDRPGRPALATLPCVTEASRTSLFCGRLSLGNADTEAAGFAGHAGLRAHCRSGSPPLLFHKVDLQGPADASLAATVREAVASPQKRVVGVVLNAVDDHLHKGEQLDLRWRRDTIKALPSLLYEARSARRVVILLSDHGHLLDDRTEQRPGDGGERWRQDNGSPGEGELAVQGPRVLLGRDHRLIAPWTERVRYVGRKNGYHGGLTPQEMLIPITVLVAGDVRPAGWSEIPDLTPDWWEAPVSAPPPTPVPALKPQQPQPPQTLWDLVQPEPEPPTPALAPNPSVAPPSPEWLAPLLASPLFEAQKKLAGRTVPDNDLFSRLLGALDGAGGRLTAAALARKLALPLFRLRGLLAVVQRVLNLDGYAVLGRDDPSDTVSLNRTLLLEQFDLLAEGRP
jgi:hypothetical protein